MAQGASKRCFLDLAFETRIEIYKYAFGHTTALIQGQEMADWRNDDTVYNVVKYQPRSAQLLRTCRPIWEEALPVLYENTFVVFDRDSNPIFSLDGQLTGLPSTPQIRHLELQIGRKAYVDIDNWKNIAKMIAKWNLNSLKSLTLAYFAPEWVNNDYKNANKYLLKYKDAHQKLGDIAWAFLTETGVNCVQDKSVPKFNVEYHLSTIHASRLPKDVSRREYEKYRMLTNPQTKAIIKI